MSRPPRLYNWHGHKITTRLQAVLRAMDWRSPRDLLCALTTMKGETPLVSLLMRVARAPEGFEFGVVSRRQMRALIQACVAAERRPIPSSQPAETLAAAVLRARAKNPGAQFAEVPIKEIETLLSRVAALEGAIIQTHIGLDQCLATIARVSNGSGSPAPEKDIGLTEARANLRATEEAEDAMRDRLGLREL